MVLPLPSVLPPRLLLTLASAASHHVPSRSPLADPAHAVHTLARREEKHDAVFIVEACLIPLLVILSGIFAGLTLGYMSLDETQLNVLSVSGTPKQKVYANKIKPIRKNGHLLLVTLLLANMIVNETLPVISDPVLGGGAQSVVVSTVLIVIFAEIIPQSLCTRYGLYFGAKMAGFVQVLIWTLGIIAWPVAKLLEFALGPHHGIIYRRAELKELIAMHGNEGQLGGDLKTDTVTIIGGALDLQEKVVRQAMTPIENVFMLSIDAKLDYETLRKVCLTGHSRIPVYEEVEVSVSPLAAGIHVGMDEGLASRLSLDGRKPRTQKVKKIIGILLVKQCVLLDPNDATPVRKIPLNRVPFVPNNEPLLGILDKFQEGRSHMAIVSRFSVERAASVKKAVKRGLTQRLRDRVMLGDSESSSSSSESEDEGGPSFRRLHPYHHKKRSKKLKRTSSDNSGTLKDDNSGEVDLEAHRKDSRGRRSKKHAPVDVEMGIVENEGTTSKKHSLGLPKVGGWGRWEQSMPADAVLTKEGVEEFLQSVDPAVMPLGIITLEDVLEELIGEEIYDEFDPQGHPDLSSYAQAEVKPPPPIKRTGSAPQLAPADVSGITVATPVPRAPASTPLVKPIAIPPALRGLNFKVPGFQRSRSAPPTPRDAVAPPEKEKSSDGGPAPVPEGVAVAPHEVHVHYVGNLPPPGPPLFDEKSAQLLTVPDDIAVRPAAPVHAKTAAPAVPAPMPIVMSPPDGPVAPTPAVPAAVVRARSTAGVPTPSAAVPPLNAATNLPMGPTAALPFGPPSRSASPAPSLEQAILVERKRRAASSSGNQAAVKGGWFKSSPLNGGERAGVVVAERIKRDLRDPVVGAPSPLALAASVSTSTEGPHAPGPAEADRIPDEKEKAGPDKV